MSAPQTRNFSAWINLQPPGPRRLIVTGEVETKSSTDLPVLRLSGIAGETLKLELTIRNDGGAGTQAFQFHDAQYEQKAARGEFTQVVILWQGTFIETLQVSEVH